MSAFPPHRTKVSIAVSQSAALAHLSAFLTSSESHPHLLPNAHLDPTRGPIVGSSNFSVAIHNLRRVEAGLRGEWLDPSLELNQVNHTLIKPFNDQGTKKSDEDKQLDSTYYNPRYIPNESEMNKEQPPNSQQLQKSDLEVLSEPTDSNYNVESLPVTQMKSQTLDKAARKREKKARRKTQKMAYKASKS